VPTTRKTSQGCPIVLPATFVQAIRDAGYKNTSAALAELIDNSIEAGAHNVAIDLVGPPSSPLVIRVTDDGTGMTPNVLQLALQFGGSTRFNGRSGTGRYGMGLPCSSLSQARRVGVFSWTHPTANWFTYLDIDEITTQKSSRIPPVRLARSTSPTPSGTVVELSRCDRIDYKRLGVLLERLHRDLGRIFRRALLGGLQLRINERPVRSIDPLFLEGHTEIGLAEAFGPPMEFPITIPEKSAASVVLVRFSLLPVARWHGFSNEEKSRHGISKAAGVSIVRGGREIDRGWFFMGGKRRENYDDWWRCEVQFSPLLDELFGLTHTKQRVYPTDALNSILSPHLEAAAHQLNARVRTAFQAVAQQAAVSSGERRAQQNDMLLEPLKIAAPHRSTLPPSLVQGLRYRLERRRLPGADLFLPTLVGDEVRVALNTHHVFYDQVYAKILSRGQVRSLEALEAVDLLFLAFGRAECSLRRGVAREGAARVRERWSTILGTFFS